MKRNAFAAAVFLLAATPASPQTTDELVNDGRNTDNVLTYGMGYHQNRYSRLNEINKSNVKRLVPVWNVSMNSSYGEQGQPLIYNGVMYVTDAEYTVANVFGTGRKIWLTPVNWDPATPRVV
jgi:alcohol dehydrogenase (cytochrome c)